MKKIMILALIIALIASGCSNEKETPEKPTTNTEEQVNQQTSEDAIIAPDFELET
ncbi:MAG: hypothetical protein K0Q47_1727 [Sedimentibacter sp.]|nr:hypothetical protein [Sedimentibacter sp.]